MIPQLRHYKILNLKCSFFTHSSFCACTKVSPGMKGTFIKKELLHSLISGFCCGISEIFASLGCYALLSGS